MDLSTARGAKPHLLGWLVLALLCFLQDPGRTAADTKFDLAANPAGFLSQATHAYTDAFTMGQIQNQAYGYLFPHGLFFLLTEPLPDWIAQRLWWTLLLGIAYSGTLVLASRLGLKGVGAVTAAFLYALSPRILTTLTAISSEAWPVALVPWTLVPLAVDKLRRRDVAAAIIPIALMGAVNAAATMMACLPAFLLLLYRRVWKPLAGWLAGTALVSGWWIGPLLVLGWYSAPFLDFIESSYVTTRWLNLAEILRGTTSWAPFADTERVAGHLLVTEPVFVLATLGIAAIGIAGLASRSMPWRGYLVALLCAGIALLSLDAPSLLDGPFAPFRNLHKLDPLVRLPLVLGAAHVVQTALAKDFSARSTAAPRTAAAVAVALVAVIATAPAWSLRLMPLGTWESVPEGWNEAAGTVDKHAAGTRTLVAPEASFVRQEWGWPRDEPLQALATSNFATRDAIPLVDPEAIRGLDGLMAVAKVYEPGSDEFAQAARGFGVGAVLDRSAAPTKGADAVTVFDPHADMMITDGAPWDLMSVSGGGEVLPMLDAQFGYAPRQLSSFRGGDGPPGAIRHDIVTDTPALAVRNYGTLDGPMSYYLPSDPGSEGGEIRNRLTDYPSDGIRVTVEETGGSVRASSSAADATAFGGANPSRSVTSAVDGLTDTAWYPAPGDPGWIEVTSSAPTATVTATGDVTVRVTHIGVSIPDENIKLIKGEPTTIDKPGSGLRLYLGTAEDGPFGIEEIDAGVHRVVTVKQVGDNYFFQRLMPATDLIHRAFTVERDTTYTLSAPARIDGTSYLPGPIELTAGRHELISEVETVALTTTLEPKPWQPVSGHIEPADHERTILTTRSHNGGLRGQLTDGDTVTELKPVKVGAGQQGFIVPPGAAGDFTMTFAADTAYRASLFLGGAVSLLTLAACVWMLPSRRPSGTSAGTWVSPQPGWIAPAIAALGAAGWPGALVFVVGLLIRRFTLIRPWVLGVASISMMALWMARAPWPSSNYAGDSVLVALAGALALAAVAGSSLLPDRRLQHFAK